jgi:hypothetical protein
MCIRRNLAERLDN